MAGMQTNFLNNPRWQKAVQRLSRLDPERKAIFDTIAADEVYADQEMRQYLLGARDAADQLNRDRSYKLSQDRLAYRTRRSESALSLKEDEQDWQKGQAKKAQGLGWLNIGVSGLAGVGDYMDKRRQIKHNRTLAERWGKK